MQKVYLLLRNNQQTGPFNLEELVKFGLKPFDLIWIEGKSAGWYYPQEIKALHPYLPFIKTEAPVANTATKTEKVATSPAKKVFVSMPVAAALKEEHRSFSEPVNDIHERYKPGYSAPEHNNEEVKTNYAKTLEEVESNYTDWMYKQKTKKKNRVSRKGLVAACLITTIAFAGWLTIKKVYDSDDKKIEPPITENVAVQNEIAPDSVSRNTSHSTSKTPLKKQRQAKPSSNTKAFIQTASATSVKEQIKTVAVNNAPANNDYETSEPKKQETKAVEQEKKSEPVVAETPKEKKKLRDKIFDIFRKKPSGKNEEAKPAEEENGERRATRREADASLAQMVSVSFTVPNDWMMGIKGAKATLNNRSSETIAKATLEVQYYNDDNEVLEKRTISFFNIGAKKSQTVSIPDHSSATRLGYKIISVTGSGEPFAKL